MQLPAPPRAILALVLILALMTLVHFGEHLIVKAMSILVYPFVIVLMALSLYLIPHWNASIFEHTAAAGGNASTGMLMTLWLVIPVMVFSFNHSPIISSLQ